MHTPPGFNLIILPFFEEIRKVEDNYFDDFELALNKMGETDPEGSIDEKYWKIWDQMKAEKQDHKEYRRVDEMQPEEKVKYVDRLLRLGTVEDTTCKELIDAFCVDDFSPLYFENPEIQTFYKNLQALALNHENAEKVEDHIQPDQEGLQSNADLIEHFKDTFNLDYKRKNVNSNPFARNLQKKVKKTENLGVKRNIEKKKVKKPKKPKEKKIVQEFKKEDRKENHKNAVFVVEEKFVSDSL